MKKIALILLFCGPVICACAQQVLPDHLSLIDYAPKITRQDGENCFAYATAYVALSTQYAFVHHLAPDANNVYSFGYVDAIVEHYGRGKMQRFCQQEWGGNRRAYEGLDFALYVLLHYGTVYLKTFPYTLDKEAKAHFNMDMLAGTGDLKITDINELVTPDDYRHTDAIFLKFEAAIASGHPVMCAIKEDATVCEANFVQTPELDSAPMSNHIINVIGYDATKRTLTVKNNFGTDCTFEIPADTFCKALSWAYTLVLPD